MIIADADRVHLDAPLLAQCPGVAHATVTGVVLAIRQEHDDLALDFVRRDRSHCPFRLTSQSFLGLSQASGCQRHCVANRGSVLAAVFCKPHRVEQFHERVVGERQRAHRVRVSGKRGHADQVVRASLQFALGRVDELPEDALDAF